MKTFSQCSILLMILLIATILLFSLAFVLPAFILEKEWEVAAVVCIVLSLASFVYTKFNLIFGIDDDKDQDKIPIFELNTNNDNNSSSENKQHENDDNHHKQQQQQQQPQTETDLAKQSTEELDFVASETAAHFSSCKAIASFALND